MEFTKRVTVILFIEIFACTTVEETEFQLIACNIEWNDINRSHLFEKIWSSHKCISSGQKTTLCSSISCLIYKDSLMKSKLKLSCQPRHKKMKSVRENKIAMVLRCPDSQISLKLHMSPGSSTQRMWPFETFVHLVINANQQYLDHTLTLVPVTFLHVDTS